MSDSTYLTMTGFDVLSEAEMELRNELGAEKGANSNVLGKDKRIRKSLYKEVKESLQYSALVESITIHSTLAGSIWGLSLFNSFKFHYSNSETLLCLLSLFSLISRIGNMAMSAVTAYFIRLNQRVHQFEVKRMQHDIRACSPSSVDLLVPRLNTLLKEMHAVCKSQNQFLLLWCRS